MGRVGLSNRDNWQTETMKSANKFEEDFYTVFENYFRGTDYRIRKKPNEFSNLYVNQELDDNTLNEIYTPEIPINKHGISPDFAIDNLKTGKTIFGDNKRQDGWVEGGERKDGRGNAHERMCKYFTPGLTKQLRSKGKIDNDKLPFWIVLRGNITRDPCRVREITLWFDGNNENLFFWRDKNDTSKLINHFETQIKPILE